VSRGPIRKELQVVTPAGNKHEHVLCKGASQDYAVVTFYRW